jgi:hypothetical protein
VPLVGQKIDMEQVRLSCIPLHHRPVPRRSPTSHCTSARKISPTERCHVASLALSFLAELAFPKGLFDWILRRWAE